MAHSYLDYHGNHVRLRDEHIEWLMESVLRESTNIAQMPPGLTRLLDWWSARRNRFGPGCIELPLDECLQDPKSAKTLTEILALLYSKVREPGFVIDVEESTPTVQANQDIINANSIATHCDIISNVKNLIDLVL